MTSNELQKNLEQSLRSQLSDYISPEFVMTWKSWDMLLGQPICRLRALGRRTSGNGSSGWPTPSVINNLNDSTWQERRESLKQKHNNGNGFGLNLGQAATLVVVEQMIGRSAASGTTANTKSDATTDADLHPDVAAETVANSPTNALDSLENASLVDLTGWPTPTIPTGGQGTEHAKLVGGTYYSENGTKVQFSLQAAVKLIGAMTGSSAPMESTDVLASEFPCWLQGYPATWANCAVSATP